LVECSPRLSYDGTANLLYKLYIILSWDSLQIDL
jgi:hypothetical protein